MELIEFDPIACPEAQETLRVALALSLIQVELVSARRVVCMAGAGTSTSVGIRDFRSKDVGLYTTRPSSSSNPLSSSPSSVPPPSSATRALFHSSVYTTTSSRSQHLRFVARLRAQVSAIADARGKAPITPTHGFFAALKRAGKLQRVWTQNIDALEGEEGLSFVNLPGVTPGFEAKVEEEEDEGWQEESGWSPLKLGKRKMEEQETLWEGDVVQLHGSLRAVRCTACEEVVSWDAKHQAAFSSGRTLDCSNCLDRAAARATLHKRSTPPNSFLRPAIVLYDELSAAALTIGTLAAHDLSQEPDLLLVFGTSLKIPGFKSLIKDFARAVRSNNGLCVLVNTEPVAREWDEIFDYHIQGTCDDFTTRILSDLSYISPFLFPLPTAHPTPPESKRPRLITPSSTATRPKRDLPPGLHVRLLAAFEGLKKIANGIVSNLPEVEEEWDSSEEEDEFVPDSQPLPSVGLGEMVVPKVEQELVVMKECQMASSSLASSEADRSVKDGSSEVDGGGEKKSLRKKEMGSWDAKRVREQKRARERSGRR